MNHNPEVTLSQNCQNVPASGNSKFLEYGSFVQKNLQDCHNSKPESVRGLNKDMQ